MRVAPADDAASDRSSRRTHRRVVHRVLVLAAGLLTVVPLAAGCSSSGDAGSTGYGEVTLTVAAASSLTEVFPKIGAAFGRANPGTTVQFSFASSSDVAAQVDSGSPIDAIALAGSSSLAAIADKVGTPELFTSNRLVIIVPPGNPKDVQSLADLADLADHADHADVRVSLGAEGVPAGDYAREALAAADVKVAPVSLEVDVKGVVSRVALGGADAGIVYVTDAQAAAGDVEAVPIPARDNVVARYPATTVAASAHPEQAQAFVRFLLSDTAQQLLRQAGFGPAPTS